MREGAARSCGNVCLLNVTRIYNVNHERFVLDSSAVLALIEDEAGAERVAEALQSGNAVLPWITLLEVYYISRREQGKAEADQRYALLRRSGAAIVWDIDELTLLAAARLKAEHRVSLAGAIIAAYALRRGAILIHKDPEFEALRDLLPMEALPYK